MRKKLSVVGLGVDLKRHLTLEGLRTIRNSKVCLVLDGSTEEISELTSESKVEVKSIIHLYQPGAIDEDNYSQILAAIDAEIKLSGDVSLALPGSPRLGVTICQKLSEKYPSEDTDLVVVEGISSLATMTNDLQVDILERGAMILDANRLLLFNLQVEPRTDLFLYHICSVGTAHTYIDNPTKGNRWDLLQTYLLKFYDQEKELTIIRSSDGDQRRTKVTKLKDLVSCLEFVDFSTSLFIKGEPTTQIDYSFLEVIAGEAVA